MSFTPITWLTLLALFVVLALAAAGVMVVIAAFSVNRRQ